MQIKETLVGLYRETIPDPLRHRIDAHRRLHYWRRAGVIFVHVPKAAGTSVSHELYGRSLGHLKAREIRAACPGAFAHLFCFSLVRNPWDRVLSAYRFVRSGGTAVAGVRRAQRYGGGAFRSFDAFLHEWLVHQDLSRTDYVFQRQCDFLLDADGVLLVDHVGRVEAMADTLSVVGCRIGRPVPVRRMNSLSTGEDFRRAYRSSEAIELVEAVYREDIQRFGYRNTF